MRCLENDNLELDRLELIAAMLATQSLMLSRAPPAWSSVSLPPEASWGDITRDIKSRPERETKRSRMPPTYDLRPADPTCGYQGPKPACPPTSHDRDELSGLRIAKAEDRVK